MIEIYVIRDQMEPESLILQGPILVANLTLKPEAGSDYRQHHDLSSGNTDTLLIALSAAPKSSMRSSVASTPIETRMSPSVIPSLFLFSADIPECEVAAGLV